MSLFDKISIFIFVKLKNILSIFIIFTLVVSPLSPLISYVINYNFIVKNLCQNRDRPQLMCNGKCYLAKELFKTEKQNQENIIKTNNIDAFVPKEIISFRNINVEYSIWNVSFSEYFNHYHSEYFSDIFHPPLFNSFFSL